MTPAEMSEIENALITVIKHTPMNTKAITENASSCFNNGQKIAIVCLLMNSVGLAELTVKMGKKIHEKISSRSRPIPDHVVTKVTFFAWVLILLSLSVPLRAYMSTSPRLPSNPDISMLSGTQLWELVVSNVHDQGMMIHSVKFDAYEDGVMKNFTLDIFLDKYELNYTPQLQDHDFKYFLSFGTHSVYIPKVYELS